MTVRTTSTTEEVTTIELRELRQRVAHLEASNMNNAAAVEVTKRILMSRLGESLTEDLAGERAHNIIAALQGYRIGGRRG